MSQVHKNTHNQWQHFPIDLFLMLKYVLAQKNSSARDLSWRTEKKLPSPSSSINKWHSSCNSSWRKWSEWLHSLTSESKYPHSHRISQYFSFIIVKTVLSEGSMYGCLPQDIHLSSQCFYRSSCTTMTQYSVLVCSVGLYAGFCKDTASWSTHILFTNNPSNQRLYKWELNLRELTMSITAVGFSCNGTAWMVCTQRCWARLENPWPHRGNETLRVIWGFYRCSWAWHEISCLKVVPCHNNL